ncbi:hypothetical protein Tco_0681058 [Tanacetum coccineum]|uniref:Uncharacterized protein n=1 Tax=Tanacetum coccineum TaxID=301880 RepID=A0ABQ4XMJ7_9ASTR
MKINKRPAYLNVNELEFTPSIAPGATRKRLQVGVDDGSIEDLGISSFSPSSRSSYQQGLLHRPQQPRKIVNLSGDNGSYTIKQFEGNPEEISREMYLLTVDALEGKGTIKTSCFDFEEKAQCPLPLTRSVLSYSPKLSLLMKIWKENYADSKEQGISCDDVEDLDDQQFIVHTAQPMHTEERTAAKEVPLSSAEQALHDELDCLDDGKDENRLDKEKNVSTVFHSKGTANYNSSSNWQYTTDSADDISKDVFSLQTLLMSEEGGVVTTNKHGSYIDVPSIPRLDFIRFISKVQIIGKSTAGVQTRRVKLQEQPACLLVYLSQEETQESLKPLQMKVGLKRCKKNCFNSCCKRARLVAQGYRQKKVVDYVKCLHQLPEMLEAIRLFLAICIFHGLQLSIRWMSRSCILHYGNFTEMCMSNKPPGFERILLIPNKKDRRDIHVGWILKILCKKGIQDEFMGELTFFLGLQVSNSNVVFFYCQTKYVKVFSNKFDFRNFKPASTTLDAHNSLGKYEDGEDVVVLFIDFKSLQRFLIYMLSKGSLVTYDGDNHDRDSNFSDECQYLGRKT